MPRARALCKRLPPRGSVATNMARTLQNLPSTIQGDASGLWFSGLKSQSHRYSHFVEEAFDPKGQFLPCPRRVLRYLGPRSFIFTEGPASVTSST